MDQIILGTVSILQEIKFSPLVLISLLITSLSLILNLKEGNYFIDSFRKSDNIKIFVESIHKTTGYLIIVFFLSMISSYIILPEIGKLTLQNDYLLYLLTIMYFPLILLIIKNLFSISFIIKEIVITSINHK